MALFEATAAISAAIAVVPTAVGAAKAWLAIKRKHSDKRVKVTLSDGEEVTITTSKVDTNKLLELLAKVKAAEPDAPEGSLPNGEGQ